MGCPGAATFASCRCVIPGLGVKFVSHLQRVSALLAGLLVVGCLRAGAQGVILWSVTPSANSVQTGGSVTFTINLTNATGTVLPRVLVTNVLPDSVQFQFASIATNSNIGAGAVTNYGSVTVFSLTNFVLLGIAQLNVTAQPTAVGPITNTVTVTAPVFGYFGTNSAVVQVTNAVSPQADLGVAIAGPAQAVITNDWMTYSVAVTNLGPATAPNVSLTNTLPPGAVLLNVSPAGQSYTTAGSNLIFNLGALTNGGSALLQFTVEPTNVGPLLLSASVGTTGVLDTNLANNEASTNVTVTNFFGTLIATNVSAMVYNPQTGLMNQTIRLSNLGTNSVASARVIVSGLTNWLYNAVGTNNGNPFVVYANALDTNQSVDLVLEYFIPTRQPITVSNSQYVAGGVPATVFSGPGGTNGVFYITLITNLADGNILIEFQSIPGRNYTVLYSDDGVNFSNALAAQPSITATADRTQWIDDGPPKTVSPPISATNRYYRVLLNPP